MLCNIGTLLNVCAGAAAGAALHTRGAWGSGRRGEKGDAGTVPARVTPGRAWGYSRGSCDRIRHVVCIGGAAGKSTNVPLAVSGAGGFRLGDATPHTALLIARKAVCCVVGLSPAPPSLPSPPEKKCALVCTAKSGGVGGISQEVAALQ